MKASVKTVERELRRMGHTPDEQGWRERIFLLSSAIVGPNADLVSRFTGLPRGEARRMGAIARKNQIWVGRKIACEWFEDGGGLALTVDAMVLQGLLEKSSS